MPYLRIDASTEGTRVALGKGMRALFLTLLMFFTAEAFGTAGRSFGVFTVSYKPGQTRAMGGIAGTAFFVSNHRAITAYHVLQPASFRPHFGFERVKVWLVHENHAAIELTEKNMHYFPDRDETVIDLDAQIVENEYVFEKSQQPTIGSHAETEGFLVNSLGPTLEFSGVDVRVTAVPTLNRLHFNGDVTAASLVNLTAKDIALRNAPCVQLDYRPVVGMSGDPVIVDGRVVGMNSFSESVMSARTWAVTLPADI
jgi:hypothetical protein